MPRKRKPAAEVPAETITPEAPAPEVVAEVVAPAPATADVRVIGSIQIQTF